MGVGTGPNQAGIIHLGQQRLLQQLNALLAGCPWHTNRWLTIVTHPLTPGNLYRQLRHPSDSVRLIHSGDREDQLWASWEALSQGNSHTVLTLLDHLAENEYAHLDQAALDGDTCGLIVTSR